MTQLKGNLIFGQSGGPTSVINSSAAGVFLEALDHPDMIPRVFGMKNGIEGFLDDKLYDINAEDRRELELLTGTPSSNLGSCRYKLADPSKDDTDYRRILELCKKHDIRYFFYNGGNDSMDTCLKVSKFLASQNYECRVIGIPKTVDNDLCGTDHCPGFPSAARYVATSISEVWHDAHSYDIPMVVVFECMGRHAGWLTAASALACEIGCGPDLIYVPEAPFDLDRMIDDTKKCLEKKNIILISVSEGLRLDDGSLFAESYGARTADAFGHKQLGGTAAILAESIRKALNIKVRGIEFSLLQRCGAHLASGTDICKAVEAGRTGVKAAIEGTSDVMMGFERLQNDPYESKIIHVPLEVVANHEKTLPPEWINDAGNNIERPFIDYALPLIQGPAEQKYQNGLPRFARLKKLLVK